MGIEPVLHVAENRKVSFCFLRDFVRLEPSAPSLRGAAAAVMSDTALGRARPALPQERRKGPALSACWTRATCHSGHVHVGTRSKSRDANGGEEKVREKNNLGARVR